MTPNIKCISFLKNLPLPVSDTRSAAKTQGYQFHRRASLTRPCNIPCQIRLQYDILLGLNLPLSFTFQLEIHHHRSSIWLHPKKLPAMVFSTQLLYSSSTSLRIAATGKPPATLENNVTKEINTLDSFYLLF